MARLTVPQDGSKLSLWDAASGKEALVIRVLASVVGPPSFSPNGRWILCACGDKAARIWSADTGEELWCFRGHQMGFASATFSPDGTRVGDRGSGRHVAHLEPAERPGLRPGAAGSGGARAVWLASSQRNSRPIEGKSVSKAGRDTGVSSPTQTPSAMERRAR